MVDPIEIAVCTDCNQAFPASDVSRRGLCPRCGLARMRNAAAQIRNKSGPVYRRWHQGVEGAKVLRRKQYRR